MPILTPDASFFRTQYRRKLVARVISLADQVVTFSGATLTTTPMWPEVRIGGELDVQTPGEPRRSHYARITGIAGDVITVDMRGKPPFVPIFDEDGEIIVTPRVTYRSPPVTVGFVRRAFQPRARGRAIALSAILGITDGDNLLIVGDTLGWTAEGFRQALPASTVVSTDTSAWAQFNQGLDETVEISEEITAVGLDPLSGEGAEILDVLLDGPRAKATILDEDGLSNGSRGAIRRNGFGSNQAVIDWVITDDVLPLLFDSECIDLSTAMAEFTVNVVHVVTPYFSVFDGLVEPDPLWNWKHIGPGEVNQTLFDQPWYTTSNWLDLLPEDQFFSVQRLR